jgi:hypothetical protein
MKDTAPTTPRAATEIEQSARADADLRDLWRFYARKMNDTALLVCATVSILLVAAFAVIGLLNAHWALHWWPLVLPPVFVGAFGVWGIADSELSERARTADGAAPARMLVILEWAASGVAALAAAGAVIVFLRVTVGTWIS